MRDLKFRAITERGAFHVPSDEFSLSIHGEEIKILMWASDGIVDEIAVKSLDQFTGAKDFFETEIYEGDIVFLDSKMIVGEIVMDFFAWKIKCGNDFEWLCDFSDDLHAIGNIYENPELLEQSS